MEILFWIWLLTWMFKTAAQDVIYAVRGEPNPRYELKKAKALREGRPAPVAARYGTREWFADLYSDALAAHTERRRAKTALASSEPQTRARPETVDDMVDVAGVRPQPDNPATEPDWLTPDRDEPAGQPVVHDDQHPYCVTPCGPNCLHHGWQCLRCSGTESGFASQAEAEQSYLQHTCPTDNTDDGQPLATVIPMFPNPKEINMSNAEITGLPTAIAFAQGMANAHRAASSAGGEEYVAALRKFEVGEGTISSVGTAREMSSQAAAAWDRVAAEMGRQTTVKEAYDAVPDAGNKAFVTGE